MNPHTLTRATIGSAILSPQSSAHSEGFHTPFRNLLYEISLDFAAWSSWHHDRLVHSWWPSSLCTLRGCRYAGPCAHDSHSFDW